MKRIFVLAAVVVMLFALPAVAMASGWSAPAAGVSPHGGWGAATNYCKVCHAVHEAENVANTLNGEKLLRSTTIGACDYCHVSVTIAGIAKVYDADNTNYAANTGMEHTLGLNVVAPDSGDAAGAANPATDYSIATFGCVSCHSVHAADTILAGVNILKANPIGDGDDATTQTEFCADCHDNNLVTAYDTGAAGADQVSHYMGVQTKGLDAATSADCRDCHSGGTGVQANSYPHMTTGDSFLLDGTVVDQFDAVCVDCHSNVGVTY